MKTPEFPKDETNRIDTLRALNILDTSAEERFDRLTRLAKRLFGVPIALISLVDADRQWFKSSQGLEVGETPRDISFCGHAILGDDILMVEDATLDERFHDNPLVTDNPNIRFYAGFPLKVANGSKLGTLCVIDREPRVLSEEDRELLSDLGRMAEQEIAAVQLATMDELTLLSNRRGFLALSGHALSVCRRMDKPASMLFFDLDGFKQINDRYGHAEGDRALRDFAALLRDACRDADVVGRLGGDEFVVFLTDAGKRETRALLSRVQARTSEYNAGANRGYSLRFSVGRVTHDPRRHSSVADMLEDSDKRMYADKKGKAQRCA